MGIKSIRSTRSVTAFFIILIVASPILSILPVFAANVTLPFQDGFETGNFSKWSVNTGGYVISGDAQHGTYKAVLNATDQYQQARFTGVDTCFMRAYVMFKTFPNAGYETTILGVYNYTSGHYMAEARVGNFSSTNTVKWRLRYYDNGVSYTVTSEMQKPVLNTWYCVEVEATAHSTTSAEARLYINGVELTDISQTGKNNNEQINCGYIWEGLSAATRWYDDVVVDTSYIGPETYTLTTSVIGQGSISKCPDQPTYNWGTNVQLTAHASQGWTFAGWSDGASGTSNPVDITITDTTTVTATFTQNVYTLTVSTDGSGSVNLNKTAPYHYGDVVELTAVPTVGWSFDSWSGDLTGSVSPSTIVISGNMSVSATFTQNVYTLDVSTVGNGAVELNNTGPYHYGDVVGLTAVQATGWSFSAWSGDIMDSANPATITIDGNKSVTATFIQNEYTLDVSVIGSGSVELNNTGPYHYGDIVELTAVPSTDWNFDSWSGDLSGSVNPSTIVISGDMSVTATFTVRPNAVKEVLGTVGITGYKLLFKETMNNTLGSPIPIDYYWNFSIDKWNGTAWIAAGIDGSSALATDFTIPANAAVDLPYHVYLLPSSGPNEVKWGDWLRINYTFHWTYIGTNYSTEHVAKLHVHPPDIAGASTVAFPYLRADNIVNVKDTTPISLNWQKIVEPSTDPASALARADINGDGVVNIKDVTPISLNWQKTWTDTPPD